MFHQKLRLLPLSELYRATSICIFCDVSKQKGRESIFINDWGALAAAMQEYSGSLNIIRLLAVAANWIMQGWRQTRTICCTSQNSYIHKRRKMVKFGEKSVSPRAFIILIRANQHQSESVICDDKNQYWSGDGGRLISCSEADYQVINDPNGAFGTFRTTSLSKLSKSYQTWSERPHHLKL